MVPWAALSAVIFLVSKRRIVLKTAGGKKRRIFPFSKGVSAVISAVLSLVFIAAAAVNADLASYIRYLLAEPSAFIEDNYVDPKGVGITFPEDKQNLIVIYLESMETSFLSADKGGANDVDPLPELYRLAGENVNFSQNGSVGGFTSPYGTDWTIAALVSFASGVPLKVPAGSDGNEYGGDSFLPNLTTINDILNENGYYQAFMCGSDSSFGSRRQFYKNHCVDDVFDITTARKESIVAKNYKVWWGMEDLHLFEYAKKKLTEISKGDKPFAFSMLTVDTHHVGGYYCSLCKREFPEQYENVIACSSRQVYDFVNWIKKQDFYSNTTIVILGDHPTMDNEYAQRNIAKDYDRKVYNCIINPRVTTDNTKNREVLTFDMFPTMLAAIGCKIEGDRLGLGANLFSGEPSLGEKYKKEDLNSMLSERSVFYEEFY